MIDKYEYKLKFEQMKVLTDEGDYESAAEIADTIQWRKVRNINLLIKAGDIYSKLKRYEDAKDILQMAYDRSPIGRMIIYRLAEIAIKTRSFEEAKDYCEEFVKIAPHDNLKYVLRYKISKAKGADLQTRIAILEELKESEYTEEWAFELAYLYHKAGEYEKCIDACDELILWFGDGIYVERALELKMLHKPLTKTQEDKYRACKQRRDGVKEVYPQEEVVRIPEVKEHVGKFDTAKLQEEIKKNLGQILNAGEKETVEKSMDSIDKMVQKFPYLQKQVEEQVPDIQSEPGQEMDDFLRTNMREALEGNYGEPQKEPKGEYAKGYQADGWERTSQAIEAVLQSAEQKELEYTKAQAIQKTEDIMDLLADVIPKMDGGATQAQLMQQEYLSGDQAAERRGRMYTDVRMRGQPFGVPKEEVLAEPDLLRKIKRAKPKFREQLGERPYIPRRIRYDDVGYEATSRGDAPGSFADLPGMEAEGVPGLNLDQLDAYGQQPERESADFQQGYEGQAEPPWVSSGGEPPGSSGIGIGLELPQPNGMGVGLELPQPNGIGAELPESNGIGLGITTPESNGIDTGIERPKSNGIGFEVESSDPPESNGIITGIERLESNRIGTGMEPLESHGAGIDVELPELNGIDTRMKLPETNGIGFGMRQPQLNGIGVEPPESYGVELEVEPLEPYSADAGAEPSEPHSTGTGLEPPESNGVSFGMEGPASRGIGIEPPDIIDSEGYEEYEAAPKPPAVENMQMFDSSEEEPIASEEMRMAEAEFYGVPVETLTEGEQETPPESLVAEMLAKQDTKEIKSRQIEQALAMRLQSAPIEDEEDEPGIVRQEAQPVPKITGLDEGLKAIFSYFVPVAGMETQICEALTGALAKFSGEGALPGGNILIQGGRGCGKTILATRLVKALKKISQRKDITLGKIDAEKLNQKDLTKLLEQVRGGCLVIEQAGEMTRETAIKLSLLLENDDTGILVILEDTRLGLEDALKKDEAFARKFTHRIIIPVFTSDELVEFGKTYAHERDYEIDNMGVLALYNRISNIQKLDTPTTLIEIKDIVDQAIQKAEKKSWKKALSILTSRRYNEDDYIMLREKDFEE